MNIGHQFTKKRINLLKTKFTVVLYITLQFRHYYAPFLYYFDILFYFYFKYMCKYHLKSCEYSR